MKTFIIFLFSIGCFGQNEIKVDIASIKQIDKSNIDMYIHTRPISRANKGIKFEINIFESDYKINPNNMRSNRFKDTVDQTSGDYDWYHLQTKDGIITRQNSKITSKYYLLEVILIYKDGSKKREAKVLTIQS